MDNWLSLVSYEMKESWMSWESSIRELFLYGLEQMEKWSDKTSHCLRQCVQAHAEGKPWQQELQKYLLAYRSTPHTTTGVSPAEQLYGRKIRTKMPELKAPRRKKRDWVLQTSRHETRMVNGNREVLMVQTKELWSLMCQKENKLSAMYDPEPYRVVSKRGDLVVIEQGETLVKTPCEQVHRSCTKGISTTGRTNTSTEAETSNGTSHLY